MRFALGIDSRARSRGAIEFASWLRQHTDDAEIVGVHVIDQRLRVSLRDDLADEVVARAQRDLDAALQDADARSVVVSAHVAFSDSPEEGLAASIGEQRIDALLLGRIAPAHAIALQRLGRVARRLVRTLPSAVVVVPPDLTREQIGAGPVLLATDGREPAVEAARFAARLAGSLGRPLLALQVTTPREYAPDFESPVQLARDPHPALDPTELKAWLTRVGCPQAQALVVEGDVVDTLFTVAARERAPVIVTGSRRLGVADRLFSSSVGTDLARLADRAVAIVPNLVPPGA
ncbi:MAG: universal stress protein [Deltaproteobacteria bacterium]|nr:universal stress protein [Deltaproteobacteria bacterium]